MIFIGLKFKQLKIRLMGAKMLEFEFKGLVIDIMLKLRYGKVKLF